MDPQEALHALGQLRTRGLVPAAQWLLLLLSQSGTVSVHSGVPVSQCRCTVARSLLQCRLYSRCALLLQSSDDPCQLFLEFEARIRRFKVLQAEHSPEMLQEIREDLEKRLLKSEVCAQDPFLLFSRGEVLRLLDRVRNQKENIKEARKCLLKSVDKFPLNWSAWQLLIQCWDSVQEIEDDLSTLNRHWIHDFAAVDAYLNIGNTELAVEYLQKIAAVPGMENTSFVLSRFGLIADLDLDFDLSAQYFSELRAVQPHSLDFMDIYSHALYVKGERIKLSYLAKEAMDIDKFSPITCCIVGNHYNLKGNHEKALKFFAAAVRFDPNYDSAWVLMGHEYIELRNIKKAISCYQQALEIQPNNFRALYGLGQAFEIQRMHVYSLFYFKKATEIRPKDPRMWCAIGEAYERIEDFENAITSFEKAYEFQDGEGIAIAKLAKLYWDLGRFEKSEIYYLELLSLDSQHPSLHEGIHTLALAYLEKRNVKKAKVYCKILFEFPGMRNEAATLMRQVQLQEQ